jgi:hypothetical protein
VRWIIVEVGEVDERIWLTSGMDKWWEDEEVGVWSMEKREEIEEWKRRRRLTVKFESAAKEEEN